MKQIPLTRGYFALVDDEDYERVAKIKWILKPSGCTRYAHGWNKQTKRQVVMHRYILGIESGSRPLVDHVNLDGLDNRRSNLRLCTNSQNGANRRHNRSHTTSRFKGVGKRGNRWQAQIQVAGRRVKIGCFSSEEDAARAYNDAAVAIWGEYARLNPSVKRWEPTDTGIRLVEVIA
jgi:hypothetical protein